MCYLTIRCVRMVYVFRIMFESGLSLANCNISMMMMKWDCVNDVVVFEFFIYFLGSCVSI